MEFLTIFLASLVTLVSSTGTIVDKVAQKAIQSQFVAVEALQVRVDNAPTHQLLQGKVDRVRIAGRGLFPIKDIRLDTLELETDPIVVNLKQRGRPQLKQPLRLAARTVLTEADLNRALASPTVAQWLRQGASRVVLGDRNARRAQRFELLNPQIKLLANQRFQVQITLQELPDPAQLKLLIETGIAVEGGRRFQLVNPKVLVNGMAVSDRVVETLTSGFSDRADLRYLERQGILARVLDLKTQPRRMEVVMFVQVAASKR